MALTDDTLIARTYNKLAARGEAVDGVYLPRLRALIPDALSDLARAVAAGVFDPKLLRKTFALTATAGTAPLAALLADPEPPLMDALDEAELFHASNPYPFQYTTSRGSLALPRSKVFIWYTREALTIYTRNVDGSLTSLAGPISAHINYIPLISSVPYELETPLIDALTSRVVPPEPPRRGPGRPRRPATVI